MPRVSACVSVLNQAALLKQTLTSIQNQTFKDWECIVVDDGSGVSMKPVVDSMNDDRFIFHRFEQNKGIPFGANYAYKIAKGDYIQALGCDEFIAPEKFEQQVAYLDAHPNIALLWGVPGNGQMGPVPSWEQYVLRAHNRSKELWLKTFINLEGVPVGGASALWRKTLFDDIGYFDEKLTAFSDHEWFCRVIEKHKVCILPFRWMNEVPGHKTVCTRTPQNAVKLDNELAYVRDKHPLQYPKTDGLITLAMPVYNHAKYLPAMLDCVFKQTDQNFEVIITDDGSTDNLEEVVKQYTDPRITFQKNETNLGMMATANKMLQQAKGDFFVILSADDTMAPDFLEKARKAFRDDPYRELVASQNDFLDEEGKPYTGEHAFHAIPKAKNQTQNEWLSLLRIGNVYFGIGVYRTETLREVGGWDTSHGVISDYEMYLRLIPRHNIHIIEEPLTHTRIHGKNQSLLNPEEARKLKRRYYEAQRAYYQPQPKIVIATPFYELKGFSPYIRSLNETTRLLQMIGINYEFMELSGDSYVHRARNSMCMKFLEDPYATDLFFIDSDMAWNPHAFISILYRPEPVIGGTYPVKNKWELWTSKPIIKDPQGDPHYDGIPLQDGSSLIQAHQLAGGFLRIKRSVLEKLIESYPYNKYNDTHPVPEERIEQIEFFAAGINRDPEVDLLKEIEERMKGGVVNLDDLKDKFEELKKPREFVGEDYYFSNRCRSIGIPLFIYPNATISHYGVNGWTGNFHESLKKEGAVR